MVPMKLIPIDAHVHYHDCYRLVEFLDAAAANLRRAAAVAGCTNTPAGVLMLADMVGQNTLQTLAQAARSDSIGPWRLQDTQEDCSLAVCRGDELTLVLIAGRQIACNEGVELLALACGAEFADGLPVRETLDAVRRQAAIPVLPWGFGKWWFRRGQLIRQLLEEQRSRQGNGQPATFVGDNGGRPQPGWEPPLFETARELGVRILPGSDPLPFPSQTVNAGRYGLILPGTLDSAKPARQIKDLLASHPGQPPFFGRRERLTTFVRCQVAMQLRKRTARARP